MSTKPLWYRWARVYFAGTCIIGTGVILYKFTTPSDEELIAAFSPEVRAEYELNRAVRRREAEELYKIVQKTSASNDPIWKTGPIGSPFERDQRNLSQTLVDYEQFKRDSGNDFKKVEVKQAKLQLLEAEQLKQQQQQNSSWWNWSVKK